LIVDRGSELLIGGLSIISNQLSPINNHTMPAKPIPDGYEGATPYLCCKDAANALEFYKTAFGAKELMRMPMPDGKVGHAEIQIGGARIMLADEFPDWGCLSPSSIGGSATSVMIYFEDVDAVVERAVAGGAKVLQPVTDQFYGDRSCKREDPSGHTWMFATHKEDVDPDELKRRADAMFSGG
jgi:PhnB protein